MHFISEVYWNKGLRETNQDSLSLQEISVNGRRVIFGLICDGIGGLREGGLASGFATERMTEWFHNEAVSMIGRNKRKSIILRAGLRALYACNEKMKEYGEEKQLHFGTTLTMILLYKRSYMLWHCGDSRVYRIKGNGKKRLEQLTNDHTAGRNILTKCIGSFRWKPPDTRIGRAGKNNVFLICSDGFRHIIDEEKIRESLCPVHIREGRQLLARITEIAEYSIKWGETDNISAIAVKTE